MTTDLASISRVLLSARTFLITFRNEIIQLKFGVGFCNAVIRNMNVTAVTADKKISQPRVILFWLNFHTNLSQSHK
jgi:hypothetical protein